MLFSPSQTDSEGFDKYDANKMAIAAAIDTADGIVFALRQDQMAVTLSFSVFLWSHDDVGVVAFPPQ